MTRIDQAETIATLVHEKSVEILKEVGFCIPEESELSRIESAGFPIDRESQMVRITPDLLRSALDCLPKEFQLYNRDGVVLSSYADGSCFMGAGTPVRVFDLLS